MHYGITLHSCINLVSLKLIKQKTGCSPRMQFVTALVFAALLHNHTCVLIYWAEILKMKLQKTRKGYLQLWCKVISYAMREIDGTKTVHHLMVHKTVPFVLNGCRFGASPTEGYCFHTH